MIDTRYLIVKALVDFFKSLKRIDFMDWKEYKKGIYVREIVLFKHRVAKHNSEMIE